MADTDAVLSLELQARRTDEWVLPMKLFSKKQKSNPDPAEVIPLNSGHLSGLGALAGGVAHEINNPLGIILLHASKIQALSQEDRLSNDQVQHSMDRIAANVERISQIIKSLRQFALDEPLEVMEPKPMKQVLSHALNLCQARFESHGVELIQPYCNDEIRVPCRGTHIPIALFQLLLNAFEAVTESQEKWVRIDVTELKNKIEVAVIDSGHGVPQEIRHRIMEPFFTTKVVGKGMGLGLSIASQIVSDHGGALVLDLSSEKTRFVFQLPKVSD